MDCIVLGVSKSQTRLNDFDLSQRDTGAENMTQEQNLDVMAGGLSFRLRCSIGASLTLVAVQ